STLLTPKEAELIAVRSRHEGGIAQAQRFFEDGLGVAFSRLRQSHQPDWPLTVYYAFKQVETDEAEPDIESDASQETPSTGWETMLAALMHAGFSITGTWPMRTELTGNLKKPAAALASSTVLVCRPRPADAPQATRKQLIDALRRELPDALRNLQR